MAAGSRCDPGSTEEDIRWWRASGLSDRLDVFDVDLAAHPGHEAAAWEWLSRTERERWRRFLYPGPARRFALCRGALRAAVCEELGCRNEELSFGFTEFGKPFPLVGGERAPLEVNISHSGGHGLLALSRRGRVGVDVEERRFRKDLDGLVGMVFGPEEREILSGLQGDKWLDAFLLFWTTKEALAKAWGMGLGTDFTRFQTPAEIRSGKRSGLFRRPELSAGTWRVENIGNSDMAAAVAYEIGP